MRDETKELNEETRRSAGGAFIQLSNGITHYELGGNESGEIVVLVHGFSVPYFIYNPTFEFLTQSGFRVLRYDLFGRGFSDRPHMDYDLNFFIQQLTDLLDTLRITQPVNLIGLSMGGPIASAFTVRHPGRVRKLILIDPAGAQSIALSPLLKLVKMPLVPEAILSVVGSGAFIKSIAKDFFDPTLVEHFQAQYAVQMQYKGFKQAILSTVRNGMLESFLHIYEALGKMKTPTLLFWGHNDNTVPFEHSHVLRAEIGRAHV